MNTTNRELAELLYEANLLGARLSRDDLSAVAALATIAIELEELAAAVGLPERPI